MSAACSQLEYFTCVHNGLKSDKDLGLRNPEAHWTPLEILLSCSPIFCPPSFCLVIISSTNPREATDSLFTWQVHAQATAELEEESTDSGRYATEEPQQLRLVKNLMPQ